MKELALIFFLPLFDWFVEKPPRGRNNYPHFQCYFKNWFSSNWTIRVMRMIYPLWEKNHINRSFGLLFCVKHSHFPHWMGGWCRWHGVLCIDVCHYSVTTMFEWWWWPHQNNINCERWKHCATISHEWCDKCYLCAKTSGIKLKNTHKH